MRCWVWLLTGCLASSASAQLDVPVLLELDGATEAERQVVGLADPIGPDAALSVDALRSGVVSTTTTIGSSTLIGELDPAPSVPLAGMLITILPEETNLAGASLDLNGTGPLPILKWGTVPVDSADLPVRIPTRLIYAGTHYLVLNTVSRPCPKNTSVGSTLYCIDDSSSVEGTFYQGVNACASRGGRLCSFGEWTSACRKYPGFIGTVTAYEWVDDAANSSGEAKTIGGGYDGPNIVEGFDCRYGLSRDPALIFRHRCCFDR